MRSVFLSRRSVILLLALVGLALPHPVGTASPRQIPPGTTAGLVKVAFIGDQALTASSRAVLDLIHLEGADMVLHQGDFDYADNPAAWDSQINEVLGVSFPYFVSIGNHDVAKWGGY